MHVACLPAPPPLRVSASDGLHRGVPSEAWCGTARHDALFAVFLANSVLISCTYQRISCIRTALHTQAVLSDSPVVSRSVVCTA